MKYFIIILVLVIVTIIGWNVFPMIIGLIRFLLGLSFVVIFVLGIALGMWVNKGKE